MRESFSALLVLAVLLPTRAQELHFWGEELSPVFSVLQNGHLSASMELAGRCDQSHLPGFPQFSTTLTTASSALMALRELATSDAEMRVEQDANGTIRMAEQGVPNDVLNIRISHVVFNDY